MSISVNEIKIITALSFSRLCLRDIVDRTGLYPQQVQRLVKKLISKNWLLEKRDRYRRYLFLNPDSKELEFFCDYINKLKQIEKKEIKSAKKMLNVLEEMRVFSINYSNE